MAVRLRLRRIGKKKQPYYRIVAIDSRAARDGKYLENVGTYNPRTEPATIALNAERTLYWLDNGAKPSDTVRSILSRQGVLLQRHLRKRGLDSMQIEEQMKNWQVAQDDRRKRLDALREQRKREGKKKKKEENQAEPAAAVAA